MTSTSDLLNFLRDLANHLALGTPLPWDQVNESLQAVEDTLHALLEKHREPAPAGAETVQELMVEALELFLEALDGIYDFLETKNRESLVATVVKAEEANDILQSIEYHLQQSKDYLSQFAAG